VIRLSSTRASNCADPSAYPQPVQQQTASSFSFSTILHPPNNIYYNLRGGKTNFVLWAKYYFWTGMWLDQVASFRSDCTCGVQLETVLLVLTVPSCLHVSMEPDWCRVEDSRLHQLVGLPTTTESNRVTHTQVHSLWDQAIGKQFSVILQGRNVVPPWVPLTTIRGLIPQSLQLQALVRLASLGWCCKSGECAKTCARRSVCFCNDRVQMAVLVCLRSNCSFVTEDGGP